ncbi:MAG: filamentous hemagglutinin N-terminal domain-containing protein [Aquabacterium sp.]
MKLQSAAKLRRRVATLRPVVLALMGAGCMSVALAGNLPQFTGSTPVAGGASVDVNGNVMTVTQTTRRAVWEAFNFSIGEGYTFVNNGPTGSLTLVRVTGFGQSSQINGTLTANNTFMLVNPYGIYVGPKAVITAGNLLMSAKDLRSDLIGDNHDYNAFMTSATPHLVFNANVSNGYGDSTIDISKGAKITATDQNGSIYLVADNVRNQGDLTASAGGEIDLLAVPAAVFDVGDSGFITMTAYTNYNYGTTAYGGYGGDFTNRVAVNTGSIEAPDGTVKLVGVGARGEGNKFDDIDAQAQDAYVSTPLYTSGVDGGYGSGAFNSGTIKAAKASLVAQGPGSIAAVTGTVTAKAISMSGETVRVGLSGDAGGQLIADTPEGGGTIDLGDTARAQGDATDTKWVYVSGDSIVSASATNNGKGGTINLMAMYADASSLDGGAPEVRVNYGQIEAYGSFLAQGGPNGGAGGTVNLTGQQINLSHDGVKGRFLVAPLSLGAANGSLNVTAPYVNIGVGARGTVDPYGGGYGGHYDPRDNGISWIDPDVIADTLGGAADVHVTASSNGWATAFDQLAFLRVKSGVEISTSAQVARTLFLKSDNELTMESGTRITALAGEGGGPLHIQMETLDGSLSFQGTESAPVTIDTTGQVKIKGVSQYDTGVAMGDTNISALGGIDVRGVSQHAPIQTETASARESVQPAALQVQPDPAGVDIGQRVVLNGGQGGVSIVGRSASGDGVRIQDLTLVSTVGALRPRMTIAGQSTADGGLGVNVLDNSAGIQMHDQQGTAVASTADVVIGGTAASGQDIELGTPTWNTTGSVNIRPLSVDAAQLAPVDNLNKPIRVGTTVKPGEFLIKPQWFNATANGGFDSNVAMVLGSSTHVGKITVEDNALDGAGNVTLQNQGQGAGGIELGRQDIIAQTLNLVTAGNITQTGRIMVNNLRIIAGTGASVALGNAQNQINGVSSNNQPAGIAPAGVASQASLANADSSGIMTYDQTAGVFRVLSIANDGTRVSLTPYDPTISRPFDGPDTLNDLRTDVYVHGQLSRPQICTAANTSGSATAIQGGAEPLALEWTKVKRSAQLSNCSGVQTDSSCSAF